MKVYYQMKIKIHYKDKIKSEYGIPLFLYVLNKEY